MTTSPKKKSRRLWVGAVALLGLPMLLAFPVLGIHHIRSDAEPYRDVEALYDAFDALLGEVVRGERVDYGRLLALREELDRVVATFAVLGPSSSPQQFAGRHARLAYYINAYNALTLFGVVEHWPIESVHDVHGWWSVTDGFGFFWAMRVRLDGGGTNLYDLENDIIREEFGDPRIHAAINCASRSCPSLAPETYRPATLDAQLDAASRSFASDPRHVLVDDDAEQVLLSSIFTWFADDFAEGAIEDGSDRNEVAVLEWIARYASQGVVTSLARARADGYSVVYRDYDWALNAVANVAE